ncbi:VTT domain-containing protein [bacterium]|nr:VTT domain-containing protein [bacterium]
MLRKKIKVIIKSKEAKAGLVLIILFVLSSYLSGKYSPALANFITENNLPGEFIYTIIMVVAVIIAPFETLPLIPLATKLWGANTAALLTILGWTIGSIIAFGLSRRYGKKFVCRIIDKCDIDSWSDKLPRRNLFWIVAFARFVLPVDIISYAVGLFTKMPWLEYLGATVIGVAFFAFIVAYGSELAVEFQAIIGLALIIIILFKYGAIRRYTMGFIKKYKA